MTAGIFGLLALFARALGGIVSDKVAIKKAWTDVPKCCLP